MNTKTVSHSGRLIGAFTLLHSEQAVNHADARIQEKFLKSVQAREWLDRKYPKIV